MSHLLSPLKGLDPGHRDLLRVYVSCSFWGDPLGCLSELPQVISEMGPWTVFWTVIC